MKIVLATSNKHKVQEINDIVDGLGIEFILPPEGFDPVENGETFEENSRIKALAAWEISKTGRWRMIPVCVLKLLAENREFILQDMQKLRKNELSAF